jgi:hypothetical protein
MLPNKDLLTPGPWTAKGNTIKDAQGRTIAYVVARNATAHAYWFAEVPNFASAMSQGLTAHEDEMALLREEVTALRRENDELHRAVESMESAEYQVVGEK